ncbi:MAG TPA: exodeoxyribonuclease III [Streptosporangiaceae bacterium]
MRFATWNVNSVKARLPKLLEWLEAADCDVVCLQELKTTDADFPAEEVKALGYESATHADGRWNGVAVLSRVGIADVVRGLDDEPGFPEPEARAVAATCGPLRVWSVYVPNGREVTHEHYQYKLKWLAALRATVEKHAGEPIAVCGDFNVAPRDEDVWDIAAFEGATHVTPAERAAVAALGEAGLREVMPRALKYDTPYTYWDYRQLAFPKNTGMRIDLVWASEPVAGAVTDAYVDREARKGKGTSDHAPVVVDADL